MTHYELHAQLLKRHFSVIPGNIDGIPYINEDGTISILAKKKFLYASKWGEGNKCLASIYASYDKCHVDSNGTLHLDIFTI